MEYISSKQAAKIWGVSPRRVVMLANEGKIDGAVKISNRWLIPKNSQNPIDSQKKIPALPPIDNERYVYPYILCCINSEEQVEQFTQDEKDLYQLILLYESGEFRQSRLMAENLLNSSTNRYIKLGALFFLSILCLYLKDFVDMEKYILLFRTAFNENNMHRNELDYFLEEFDLIFIGTINNANSFTTEKASSCSSNFLPELSVHKLYSDLTNMQFKGTIPDIAGHEIICSLIESQGFFYDAMYMHIYLSFYYASIHETDKEYKHMKQAIEIGIEHNTIFSLAYSIAFDADMKDEILKSYPPDIKEKFNNLFNIFINARAEYSRFRGNSTMLSKIDDDDFTIISYCLKNYTVKKIAENLGLSLPTTKRRLSALYKKLDVKNKNELIYKFILSVTEADMNKS